jgi:hypothetical protein
MKLLTSCLGSRATITSLDIRSCYYCQSSFDSIYFRSCIEQLTYLKTFKLDYFILSCKLIDSILTSKNRCLENLDIILKETSWHDHVIDDEQWCLLSSACPNLKVTLVISKSRPNRYRFSTFSFSGNVYHYGELRLYLKQSMPIVSLSIVLPRVLDRGGRCNFRKTLNLLVTNYHRTLGRYSFFTSRFVLIRFSRDRRSARQERKRDFGRHPHDDVEEVLQIKKFRVQRIFGESASTEDLFLQHHVLLHVA